VRPVNDVERAWRWCRRNPGWAAMIAAVAFLLVGITGVSSGAYVQVSAQNVEIEKKRKDADDQRKIAERATDEAKKKRREAEIARDKEIEQTKLAKSRLDDSIQTLGLFTSDAKTFCDDALVPGDSRVRLYKVLADHLEKQAANQEAGEASVDTLRNRVWMYQNIAGVWSSLGNSKKAEEYYQKGIEAADHWLKLDPDDAHALSHRAALQFARAAVWESGGRSKLARETSLEVLAVRRKLLDNPQVDQFTPGKSITDLAESLDGLKQYEESLRLRERVYDLHVQRKLPTFVPLDRWAWTCSQAGDHAKDYAKKKEYLTKADELNDQAIRERPGSRATLARAAKIARSLGELEYNHGKLAEKVNPAEAARYYDTAHKHFKKLADVSKLLAVSPDLVERTRDYARSFYTLGLIDRERGRLDEARANFKICLQIREQALHDYKGNLFESNMKFDRLFALVAVGDHAQAHSAAKELHVKNMRNQHNLYRLACIYSLCIPAVEEGCRPKALTPEDKDLQEVYRTTAFDCLEASFREGYANFFHTRIDADLAPIRDDPRFKEILTKYENKK
jgi:tetratricopeptide (TPR) repeat protein